MKKKSFLVLTSGKFLEALGSRIRTCSIFWYSFSLSNNVVGLLLKIQNSPLVFFLLCMRGVMNFISPQMLSFQNPLSVAWRNRVTNNCYYVKTLECHIIEPTIFRIGQQCLIDLGYLAFSYSGFSVYFTRYSNG